MKQKFQYTLLLIATIFIASCSGESSQQQQKTEVINVKTEIAKMDPKAQQLSYSAKVEAGQFATLSTRISGNISSIKVKAGQQVKKGQVLITISNRDLLSQKAQLKSAQAEAQASFDNVSKDLKRFETLFNQSSASQKELDDIRTQFEMSKARLESAMNKESEIDEALSYSYIKAPFNGFITKKFVNQGELAAPGMPLLGIENQAGFKVLVKVPEAEISSLKIGDPVSVSVKSAGIKNLQASISEINPSSLHSINQYELKIELKLSKEELKNIHSGMFANVIIKREAIECITIPKDALIHKGQLIGIYTVTSNQKAMLRWVRTGKSNGDRIEILSGLTAGEQYIRSFQGKIWDGVSLNIIK